MSYQQFTMACVDCQEEWTTAFGVVGTTQIAAPTTECPHCHSKNIMKIDKRLPPHCPTCDRPFVPDEEAKIFGTDKWDGYTFKLDCNCNPKYKDIRLSIG